MRTIGVGGVISEVNGQKVKKLDDFRAAVMQSATSGFLTIKTTDNQFAVIPVDDILSSEGRLSSTYFYPITETYKELKKLVDESRK